MFQKIKNIFNVIKTNSLSLVFGEEIILSGEHVTKEIPLDHFTSIFNHHHINIIISEANFTHQGKIKITADKNLIEFIKCEQDESLDISYKKNIRFKGEAPTIEIPINFLTHLYNYGAGNIKSNIGVDVAESIINHGIGNLKIAQFSGDLIESNSVGDISINYINSTNIHLDSHGGGHIDIQRGHIDELICDFSSFGNLYLNADINKIDIYHHGFGNLSIKEVNQKAFISLESVGKISLSGKIKQELTIETSNAGSIMVSHVDTENISADLNGHGNIIIEGQSKTASLSSSGAGNLYAQNLKAEQVFIELDSYGNIHAHPLVHLAVKNTSSGNIQLYGQAKLSSSEVSLQSYGQIYFNSVECPYPKQDVSYSSNYRLK